MATIVLRRGRAKPLWFGHPWVYSEAIAEVRGTATAGDVVDVQDDAGRLIGRGLFSPQSQIRVRMISRGEAPVERFVQARLAEARELRRRIGLPTAETGVETDCYRLINSEGDGLPGLVVDVYGEACVVQFTGIGLKRREGEVYEALGEMLAPRVVYEAAAGGFASVEGFAASARVVRGDARERELAVENGVRLAIDPLGGQKTGYFLDQRENRARVGACARGARMLDCYSYGGGFALAALRGGASRATCVDISDRALAAARRNAELNALACPELVEADVFRYLETVTPRSFDLVVLDPPKFARARKDLDAALKGYRRLNALGMAACDDGALLATCSCSQLVGLEEFERMLAGAAQDAGRRVQVLVVGSQGPDHPVPPGFPEGRYLKFVLCRVTSR